jgi:hypothetical protein
MHETNKTPDWMDEVDVSPREITPEYWQTLCDIETPSAVMVSGEQMTKLMKLQDENSDETALHIARELAKGRFEDIIKLENENHEQRGQMALLREEIKEQLGRINELQKDKERLDWLIENNATYWVYTREDIDEAMNKPTQ